jgi:glutathione S-transferase
VATTLYGIPASHPVYAATLMLRAKGLGYRRIDLPQWFHRPLLRALRFPGGTVPALVLDGRRIQTTGAIARELDRIRPDPPLLPAHPEARARVETIEAWCDRDFQQMGRRLVYWALVRHGDAVDSYLEGSRLILPRPVVKPLAPMIIKVVARGHDARDEAIRQDLAALPGVLDRIDGWIADGVLGGSPPNVADYQVATSLALLMAHDDLRPIIAVRPAGELSRRLAPGLPGRMPPAFPREWIPTT